MYFSDKIVPIQGFADTVIDPVLRESPYVCLQLYLHFLLLRSFFKQKCEDFVESNSLS